jgi:hypothetical protein
LDRPVLVIRTEPDGITARVEPPQTIAPRAWVLGVAALQVWVDEGRVVARLRHNVTGSDAVVAPLSTHASLIHVHIDISKYIDISIRESEIRRTPELGGSAARLVLFVDGEPIAEAVLAREALRDEPGRRAYGHVFCRWLRDGGHELGCDLTGFDVPIEGRKAERIVVRALAVGQTVTYALVTG